MVKRRISHREPCYDQLISEYSNNPEEVINQDEESHTEKFEFPRTKFCNTFDYILWSTVLLSGILYLLSQFETIDWHLSAVGRLILIKFLPIYDWRGLKNSHCLMDQFYDIPRETFFNCDLCESVKKIDVFEDLDEDVLEEKFMNLDVPVILTNALDDWPKNTSFFNELLTDEEFSFSFPCKVSSNIVKEVKTAEEILMHAKKFDEFFIHFQNCEHNAMRALRRFTFRPKRIPTTYSPTTFNWLIWNQNYNVSGYKIIDLVEKFSLVGQISGSTYIKLLPRNNCGPICSVLTFKLIEGEMLIFTNLWDLEYKCNEVGENLAILVEIRD